MLCVLAVFIPSFFMKGSARALFVPLSLAVGFAMIASYILSSTLVPVLSVWLLRRRDPHAPPAPGGSGPSFWSAVESVTRFRWPLVAAYLGLAVGGLFVAQVGLRTEIFPQADAGQFQLRLKAPTGTRIEQTEDLTRETLEFIKTEAGPENVEITLGYVGVVPPSYPINSVYLWTGGPEEAVVRVALKPGAVRVSDLEHRLRETMPGHLREWLRQKWLAEGVPPQQAARAADVRVSFEPADIINEVMSFGSPTTVEVAVSGPKMADNKAHADKVRAELEQVPDLRDLLHGQALDYPTFEVTINRLKAGMSGVTPGDVSRSLVEATSSSRFTAPNYWRDPASGIGYQVQVEIPQDRMKSAADIEQVSVKPNGATPLLVRDVAGVKTGTMPGQIDRYNMRRVVSTTANVEGRDLRRAADGVERAIAAAGPPPPGVHVDVRGQIATLRELLRGLGTGLALAILVIALLLTAYFQSVRLAACAVAGVPAVLCGVTAALLLTGTTVNLQSFMGAIMAVGVSVANAILFVTFAERDRRGGLPAREAAVSGARGRARAISMTACAMVAGMVPMALGLGAGGDQAAPLGRAVIGGLVASTLATLFVLPAVFALLMGPAPVRSASLDPYDPASAHHVPGAEPGTAH
jgi:multidrug efflux pump subunit AcrB